MKISGSRIVMLMAALVLAISASAASNVHKGSLTIGDSIQVNGTTLPAGDYTVKWEGSGPSVDVQFTQGRKVVATAPAQLTDIGAKARVSAAEVKNNPDGTKILSRIRFSGQTFALDISGGGSQSSKPSNTIR